MHSTSSSGPFGCAASGKVWGVRSSWLLIAWPDGAAVLDGLSLFDVAELQIAELHPTQVRGGSCVVDKDQMDAKASVGASFQNGQTKRVWRAWASCAASLLHVIGDELRKWDPGGLCDLAGFAGMAGDQVTFGAGYVVASIDCAAGSEGNPHWCSAF